MKKHLALSTLALTMIIVSLASSTVASAYPIFHTDTVRAGYTDVYDFVFLGGETVVIRVEGDGDTDLDCRVYDEYGNLIDSDADYSDTCVLIWTPRWTGEFKLEIENLGSVWNAYSIDIR